MVANRGEVAVRIARTCRAMGISPVAVYSEADSGAPWLANFDRAMCLGPAHPSRSYLHQEALLEAALQMECQAIHPGWGFLAENPLFAARVRQMRLAWIGPGPRAIRLMGDKALARQTVAALGLPTIPGSGGLLADAGQARSLAEKMGYPVLLKATAGGGGRGMRIARDEAELERAFSQAAAEAAAAFGNPGLYLEKYVERGRHIEFQVLADTWGHAIHLGERECSVQRRHQKLIEEAPSPALDAGAREDLGRRITQVLQAVGYVGAGTLEFFRDPGGALYFMEMNTRLQVEHPVTEMVTGLDIVELQIRIAAGERLVISQEEVRLTGHAIEARINAEDPADNFRPIPGRISRFHIPHGLGPGSVRVDTHIEPVTDISPFYDSLVAKVVAHGLQREQARLTLVRSLEAAEIEEVPTSIPAHLKILAHPRFIAGDYDTGFLEQERLLESRGEG